MYTDKEITHYGKIDTWNRLSSLSAAWKGYSTCGFCSNAKSHKWPRVIFTTGFANEGRPP